MYHFVSFEAAALQLIFCRRTGFFIGVKSGQNLSGHQLADILSADKNLHLWASVRQERDIWLSR